MNMNGFSIAGLIVVALLLVAVTWLNLSRQRRRVGWMYADETVDEQRRARPCAHAVTVIVPVFDELTSGETRVAIIARCKTCSASMLDRLRIVPESDGRLHIENATDETICVSADGELHHLWPAAARHPAQVTLEGLRRSHGGEIVTPESTGSFRPSPRPMGFGPLDDIDEEIADRDAHEGDKSY